MTPFPEPLPIRGSVPTRYANIRRAHKPTEADLMAAELIAVVSPSAAKKARGTMPLPALPFPNRDEVTRAARRNGLDPWALGMVVMGVYSTKTRGLEMRVLVVGSAKLTNAALDAAERLVSEPGVRAARTARRSEVRFRHPRSRKGQPLMPTIHTPETTGAKAVYTGDEGEGVIEREIIGWDKQGHPLVMCGGVLHTAHNAPFARCSKFQYVTRNFPSGSEIVTRALWDTDGRLYPLMDAVREHVDDALRDLDMRAVLRDAIREHLNARTGNDN